VDLRGLTRLSLVSLTIAASAVAASAARAAEFGIRPGGFTVGLLDAEGHPESRAGSHPDLLQLDFALEVEGSGTTPRDLVFELPPGFSGNPSAVPQCSRQAFGEGEECPPETQVGVVKFGSSGGPQNEFPIFELEPEPGQLFAFASKPGIEMPILMGLRPTDYGITIEAGNPQQAALSEGHLELWGVPADHQQGTTIPRRSFLTAPTRCGPIAFTFRTRSWQEGAPWLSASAEPGAPLEGCEGLRFEPGLDLQLDNPVADSPTGLRMDLSMPEEGEEELASAPIKDVTVAFPPGVTVSPGGAGGLSACSDAEFGLGSSAPVLCPDASRVGSVEIVSPVLPETLRGAVYIGEEHPGERFRLMIAAPGPGLALKFAGTLRSDPVTGRLSAVLKDLPQVSMQRLALGIDGGPGSLLASPLECGPVRAVGRFESHSGGPAVEASTSVVVRGRSATSQCPGPVPFEPELLTAGSSPWAGKPTTFAMTLRRRAGEQLPKQFTVALPPGLSASLGAVSSCSEAEVAALACPGGSRVGAASAAIGSGSRPAVLRGGVFVTGPYRRAPFGLLLEFPAKIGPFDLGTLSVRAAAQPNPHTGGVTVSVDRLPDVVEGVPVRFQAIELGLDRPGLLRNPTSCAQGAIAATIDSQGGARATATSPLTLRGCKRLGFHPRFRISLDRRKGAAPALRVSVRQRLGGTNLRAMRLSFPPALKFDVSAMEEICSSRDAEEGLCPAGSRVGTASARTPLLKRPLKGSIFVVQPPGAGLPRLGVSLSSMDVHVDFSGETSSRDGHFVTKLSALPDMPLSALTMHLGSDGHGAFSFGSGLCADGHRRRFAATIAARGQNGLRQNVKSPVHTGARCRAPNPEPDRPGERRSLR
jgi:hypothetical protein